MCQIVADRLMFLLSISQLSTDSSDEVLDEVENESSNGRRLIRRFLSGRI